MNILITGGRGFIGSHLANKLAKQNKVVVLDNLSHPSRLKLDKNIRFVYGDIRYMQDVEPLVKDCDIVYHLAAQIHVDKSIDNPQETIDTNVTGTMNVLEACRKHNKEMIFASTSEVYGSSQTGAMSELHPLDAQSPYGASKVAADRLCKAYHSTYGTNVKILRNFNTFGPGQADGGEGSSYGAVIGIFTRLALSGKPMTIMGSGEQARDYMYIDDAINAYELVSAAGIPGEVYNAGTGVPITVNNLAEFMEIHVIENKGRVYVDKRPGEVELLCADATKLRRLGWEPERVPFEEKLMRFINSYKKSLYAKHT
jgi:UDP-glucose 4-epimerase